MAAAWRCVSRSALRSNQTTAEKELPDLRVGEDGARLARHARAAELDHHAEVGRLERALGVLLHHQDRHALGAQVLQDVEGLLRSEERRVGKECRSRWSPYQ